MYRCEVRIFSCYRHLVLVTPDVLPAVRTRLRALGSLVVEVPEIVWAKQPLSIPAIWSKVFAKLHLWNMTAYDQLAFIDADAFLLDRRADELFDDCAAAGDVCGSHDMGDGLGTSPVTFNVGVMVIRPSAERYADILSSLDDYENEACKFPEQEFLANYYGYGSPSPLPAGCKASDAWWRGDVFPSLRQCITPNRGVHLYEPDLYNSCRLSGVPFEGVDDESKVANLKRYVIWHGCSRFKLQFLALCPAAGMAPPYCDLRVVQLFQRLQSSVNPCVADPRSVTRRGCAALRDCRWCPLQLTVGHGQWNSHTSAVGCIPAGWECGTNAWQPNANLFR